MYYTRLHLARLEKGLVILIEQGVFETTRVFQALADTATVVEELDKRKPLRFGGLEGVLDRLQHGLVSQLN